FALTQPALPALAIFTAMALGMAAPYLLLSLCPGWLKFLPRPGSWMDSVKQFMAFPLIGTIVWLLWVFGLQTGMDGILQALASLLVLSVAFWLWGRWGGFDRRAMVRRVAGLLAVVIGAGSVSIAWSASLQSAPEQGAQTVQAGAWESFSTKRLADLRAQGRPVFVDFGAAWCATCIVNDRMVINTAEIQNAFAAKKVALLKADWTRRNPEITKALAAYGQSG